MEKENEDLTKVINPEDSGLKELVVNYVGEKLNPQNDGITVENIIEVFSEEFPEFLLSLAEENWINGYTQALSDVDFLTEQQNRGQESKEQNESKKIY